MSTSISGEAALAQGRGPTGVASLGSIENAENTSLQLLDCTSVAGYKKLNIK